MQFTFRIVGAIVGIVILLFLVALFGEFIPTEYAMLVRQSAIIVGAIIGFALAPLPIRNVQVALASMSMKELGGLSVGALLGLVAGALASIPLGRLPAPMSQFLPAAALLFFLYLGIVTFVKRPNELSDWLRSLRPAVTAISEPLSAETPQLDTVILLDTSVIIDGRITDISKTGFINAQLLVPNFVLLELQHIADSPDPIRRKRGRRGLEVLNVLREDCPIPFDITDMDVSEVREVDSKLVALARHLSCPVMTNDYNLNRVAGLQGVTVLNINDLANAVKAAYLPGEELGVKVIQEGREHGQGVGYLDDGTMVVVEDGRRYMNALLNVVVTKVLQTSAGRMIFAKIPD